MPTLTESLPELIQRLPLDVQLEVRDLAEFLLRKCTPRVQTPLRQTWAGALRDYRTQYTSLDLQKHALTWRCEDVSDGYEYLAGTLNLDFDDAYQYVAAEVCDAMLVSFDGDFERTERGNQTPADVLVSLALTETEQSESDEADAT